MISLHYLVKLEMLIAHVLPLSCYTEKLLSLSYLNCGLKIRQIRIQLITMCGTVEEKMYQHVHYLTKMWQLRCIAT